MIVKKPINLMLLLGNFFILLSLVGFIVLFYPIINMYLFTPKIQIESIKSDEYSVFVPKISAYSPIVKDVNPWREDEYMSALKKGVAQAKGTNTPDTTGSIYLFAHSSGNPLEVNRYNTIFYRLSELGLNDEIIVTYKSKTYTYFVYDKKEVWPNEVEYLEESINSNKNQLILQTCTPTGTSLKRLLIFATPKLGINRQAI